MDINAPHKLSWVTPGPLRLSEAKVVIAVDVRMGNGKYDLQFFRLASDRSLRQLGPDDAIQYNDQILVKRVHALETPPELLVDYRNVYKRVTGKEIQETEQAQGARPKVPPPTHEALQSAAEPSAAKVVSRKTRIVWRSNMTFVTGPLGQAAVFAAPECGAEWERRSTEWRLANSEELAEEEKAYLEELKSQGVCYGLGYALPRAAYQRIVDANRPQSRGRRDPRREMQREPPRKKQFR